MYRRSGYIIFILVAGLLLFINWYAFQGVQTLVRGISPAWQNFVQFLYWLVCIALTVSAFLAMNFRRSGRLSRFSRVAFHTFLIFFISQIAFISILFAEDIYRTTVAMIRTLTHSGGDLSDAMVFPGRKKFFSLFALLFAGVPFAAFVYGVTKGKYNYTVHKHALYFKDLPEAFDGFKIVQISDVHSGSFKSRHAVQKGIDLIKAQKPDLFVFTGDMVNNEAREVEPLISIFKQIEAPFGKYAVLGNHDYGDYISWNSWEEKALNLKRLRQHHASMGHRLLLNEHVRIEKNNQSIVLMGVENWGQGFTQKGDLEKALNGVDQKDFKILLSHDPSHWDIQVKNHKANVHLTLSGHTHGMQVGIEFAGIRWSPVKYRYPNWAGITRYHGKYLNVNRGFGFLAFEGRVGIWPEVTVIELKRQ